MKKLAACTFAAVMMVALSGCSDATAEISNGSEVLISVGSEKITNNDLYRPLFLNVGYSFVNSKISKAIYDKEVPVDDDITAAAQAALDASKASLGDSFPYVYQNQGYETEEEYFQNAVIPNEQLSRLTTKFLEENAEAQIKTYKPVKVRIIECETEENAKIALQAVQAGTNFEEIAGEYGKTDTYKGNEIIVNQSSGLPTVVWAKISVVTDKEAMINEVITDNLTDATSPKYYVVQVTNTSAMEEFKDEALASIKEKSKTVKTDAMKFYLKKYDFRIYDIDVYNAYKANNPDYIVQ